MRVVVSREGTLLVVSLGNRQAKKITKASQGSSTSGMPVTKMTTPSMRWLGVTPRPGGSERAASSAGSMPCSQIR